MTKYVMLKPEEVEKLIRFAQRGDECARNRLVNAYLPRVRVIARKFIEFGVEFEDAFQVGAMAFTESIDSYDPAKGKFSTYAEACARFQMIHLIYAKETFYRNTRMQRQVKRVRTAVKELQKRNIPVSEERICEITGVKPNQIKLVMGLAFYRTVSLQAEVGKDEAGEGRLMSDLIADDAPGPERLIVEADIVEVRGQRLKEALSQLSDRESDIVQRRKGLFGLEPETLADIGDQYSISRERVRQIEKRALSKIERYLRKYKKEVAFD